MKFVIKYLYVKVLLVFVDLSDEREPWVITFILSKPQHESSCLGIVSVSLSYSCCALSRKYSCPELILRNLLGYVKLCHLMAAVTFVCTE